MKLQLCAGPIVLSAGYTYNDFGWRQTLSQSTQLPSKMDIVGHKAISVMGLGTSPGPHCDFQQKKLNTTRYLLSYNDAAFKSYSDLFVKLWNCCR